MGVDPAVARGGTAGKLGPIEQDRVPVVATA
jgi:hypothetical protein